MTNPANFSQLHQIDPRLAHPVDTVEIIDAEMVGFDEAPAIVKQFPDAAAVAQDFLIHYQSFVGAAIDHSLIWHTQAFEPEENPSVWSYPWVKAGVVGIGGLATVAAGSVLLPKDTVQNVAQATQKLAFSSTSKSHQAGATAKQLQQSRLSAANSTVPGAPLPEFSSSAKAAKPSIPKLKVSRVTSPAIRAPLPGQVISQQRVEQGLASRRSLPASSKKLGAIAQGSAKQGSIKQRTIGNPTAEKIASHAALLPALAASPLLSSSPNPQAPESKIRWQFGSTPMPPGQATEATRPSTAIPPAKIAPFASSKLNAPLPEQSKRLAPEPNRQKVILGNLSEPLNQAIEKAQTIQDFLTLSQQLPKDTQLAVLSLTSQAAIAVPNVADLNQFQVFRFPQSTYQKTWGALTQAAGKNLSVPAYGFIDYQQRAIVLPLEQNPTKFTQQSPGETR